MKSDCIEFARAGCPFAQDPSSVHMRFSVKPIFEIKFARYFRIVAFALALPMTACDQKPAGTSGAPGTGRPTAPTRADALAELQALAARLDKPSKQVRYSLIKAEIMESGTAPAPPLVGRISAHKTILYSDEYPGGRYKAEDVAYVEEFTILADHLNGVWVYAGCKGRFRKPADTAWQDYESSRKEIRMHCADELDAMRMKSDPDAE